MTVYVMNENIQCDSKACWTGATDGSEKYYIYYNFSLFMLECRETTCKCLLLMSGKGT